MGSTQFKYEFYYNFIREKKSIIDTECLKWHITLRNYNIKKVDFNIFYIIYYLISIIKQY